MPQASTEKLATVQHEFLNPRLWKIDYLERRTLIEAITELSPLLKRGRMLDVGCGMKPYESILKQEGDSYLGIDYPISMEQSYSDSTAADVYASGLQLPFPDDSFDSVISTQVLEHVPDPRLSISEASRVLSKGGRMMLAAPMAWPLHEEPFDFYRYTIHGLNQLLIDCQLHPLEERQRGSSLQTLCQLGLDSAFAQTKSPLLRTLGKVAALTTNTLTRNISFTNQSRLCLGWVVIAEKI